MTASPHGRPFVVRVATLVLVLSALPPILISQTNEKGQPSGERYWIAGRYDAHRVIVYFDAVAFNDTLSSNSHQITPPVAKGFFGPVGIDQTYARRFQGAPGAERFSLGDKYDLLLGGDLVRTVTLTDLVGAETDEVAGNDSFLGALGSLNKDDILLEDDYYVVRRHHESPNANGSEKRPLWRAAPTPIWNPVLFGSTFRCRSWTCSPDA